MVREVFTRAQQKIRRIRQVIDDARQVHILREQLADAQARLDKLEARPPNLIEMSTVARNPEPELFIPTQQLFTGHTPLQDLDPCPPVEPNLYYGEANQSDFKSREPNEPLVKGL